MKERTPHYGLRKLSVGLASVLLSMTVYGTATSQVKAASSADVNADQTVLQTNQKPTNEKASNVDSLAADTSSSVVSPKPAINGGEKTPSKQAEQTGDQPKAKTVKEVPVKAEAKSVTASQQRITKTANASKQLKASLEESTTKPAASQYDPNDPDDWGRVNIGDWDYSDDNGQVTLNGYRLANAVHIVIPNAYDFQKCW